MKPSISGISQSMSTASYGLRRIASSASATVGNDGALKMFALQDLADHQLVDLVVLGNQNTAAWRIPRRPLISARLLPAGS